MTSEVNQGGVAFGGYFRHYPGIKDPVEQIFGGMANDLNKAEREGVVSSKMRMYIALGMAVGLTGAATGVFGHLTRAVLYDAGLESLIPHEYLDNAMFGGALLAWVSALYFMSRVNKRG